MDPETSRSVPEIPAKSDEAARLDDPPGGSKTAPIRVALTKEPNGQNGMGAFVQNLAKWRDGTLVLAGLAYVLGYLSWAIYASSHGLGLAPVLDAQYFAAGVFPATIVIASCFVVWWLRWFGQWIRKPVSSSGKTVKTVLEVVGTLFLFVGFVLLWLFRRNNPVLPGVMLVIGLVATIASSFFSREKTDIWYHRILLGLAWVYLPLVGTLAFLFYTTRIFPGLPQAFGGPRPQYIQLDVDISKVSAKTLELLAPDRQPSQTNQGVVRSRNLYLFFQSSEYLFLQINDKPTSVTNQVFRLKCTAVESLFPVAE